MATSLLHALAHPALALLMWMDLYDTAAAHLPAELDSSIQTVVDRFGTDLVSYL